MIILSKAFCINFNEFKMQSHSLQVSIISKIALEEQFFKLYKLPVCAIAKSFILS